MFHISKEQTPEYKMEKTDKFTRNIKFEEKRTCNRFLKKSGKF